MSGKPPAIFLMGPTAAGKTDLAIELTKVLPCELISVDSALVYRGMDIGTAKPSKEVLAAHPHRLIDILDPAQSYSAADFRRDALEAMADITARGKIPLLVGGTMLYYKALLEGLADMPAADPQVRAELEEEAARLDCKGCTSSWQRSTRNRQREFTPMTPAPDSRARGLSGQRPDNDGSPPASIRGK